MQKKVDCSETLRQLERVFGAAKIGVDIIDSKYVIHYIDPARKKKLGDPSGKKCYQYFMGRKTVCPHCGIRKALRTKEIIVSEEVIPLENNRPILVTTVPFRDKDGKWLVAETNVDITDMKRAEEALKKSADDWRQTFDASRDMIMILDPHGAIVKANRAVSMFLGLPIDKIIGRKCYRLIHGTNAPIEGCPVLAAMKEKKSSETEMFLKNRGMWISVLADPVIDEKGNIVRIVHTIRDITERKKAEDDLRFSEQRMALHVEKTPLAVIDWDLGFRVKAWNPAAEKIFGFSKKEAIGRHASFIVPQSAKKHVNRIWRALIGQRGGVRSTNENIRKDGRTIICEWVNTPLVDTTGVSIGAASLVMDITEQLNAADALRRSERLYRTLAESARDIIFIIGTDYRYRYMNRFSAKNLHANQSEIVGQPVDKFFPKKQARAFKVYLDRVIRSGESLDTTEKVTLKTGEQWLDTRLCPIKDEHGKVTAVLGIGRDITLYKEAEAVLKRDREELERIVEVRSTELLGAQDKLNKGKRLADVGRLSATIAHELRSPFSAIRTAAYNIKMKSKDPRLQSHLANIDKKILESDQIIKNLLYYSSIKAPQIETFVFCRMMDECVALSKEIYPDRKVLIKMICKCGKDLKIEGDQIQLKEVFNNLLNNAYEAFDDKGGRIEIKAQASKVYLTVRIKDNGPGVDPKAMGKIFEPFFTTKVRGMGLGLPLCSQIISLHNGTIKMTSKPGKGAAIEVKLPIQPKVEKSQKKVV